MLTLTIPVAEAAKPRRVRSAAAGAQTIKPLTAGGAQATPAGQPASTAEQAAPTGES